MDADETRNLVKSNEILAVSKMNHTTTMASTMVAMTTRPKCYAQMKEWSVEALDSFLLVSQYTTGTLNAVLFVFATVVNVLIVLAVSRQSSLRSPSTLLLCGNVIKDLLIVSILQPVAVYRSAMYIHTDNMCNKTPADALRPFTVFMYRCISQTLWIMVSVDRWLAIRRAGSYRSIMTKKRVYIGLASAWVFCLSLSYLATWVMNGTQRYLLVFIQFGLTSALIAAIQISVYRSIKAHGTTVGAVSSVQATQAAIERRIAATVAYSVVAVAVIYIPIMVMAFIRFQGRDLFLLSSPWLEMLLLSNASINPIIWLKTSDQMRKAVLKVSCLPKRAFARQVAPVNTSSQN